MIADPAEKVKRTSKKISLLLCRWMNRCRIERSEWSGLREMLISVSWRRVPAAADHRLVGFQFV